MIIGIGSDILNIKRIEDVAQKYPTKLANKILSSNELIIWENLAQHQLINFLAKRWAAKEAFSKACGTGIRHPVLWKNITITKDKLGKPLIKTHNELTHWLKQQQVNNIHITLSDDNPYCVAFVILEK